MSFIFKITTTTSPQTFIIPCVNDGTFNATVNYGDGTGSQTVTAYNDSNLTHSFATAGQHTITIDGTFPNVRFYDNAASRVLVDEVVNLGDVGWLNFYAAFRDCINLTVFNVGTTDTSSVNTIQSMFRGCTSLSALDLSNFDTSSVSTISTMFYNCTNLTSLDLSSFDTSSVTTMQSMFYNCLSLTSLDVSGFDTSSVNNMGEMFFNCSSLTTLDLSGFDTSSVTGMQQMFQNCSSLTSLDLSGFDTSSVTSMAAMFQNCNSLTSLNLSGFNTSSVNNMYAMFRDCSSLTSLDVSGFNTSSVTTMSYMFFNCNSLTALDLSIFNTSSVNNMSYMFYNCSSLTSLNLSSFDTSSVTTMGLMFRDCSSLTSLDLSGFDTSSVTTIVAMFRGCAGLTSLNLSGFDTSSVTVMSTMFYNCNSLTSLDLSNFNTSSVTNLSYMFQYCSSLTNLDVKHFDVSNVTNGTSFLQVANNALTTTAYDELLEAWAAQDVQPNVAWHFGDAQYTVETIADWYSPRSNSSLSIINNKLVSIAGSTGQFGAAQQVDNLIIGNTYKIVGTATCSNSAASVYIRVSPVSNVDGTLFTVNSTGSVTANATFIATATTHYVGTIVTGHAANDTVTIDAGITVKEVTNYTEANAASEIEYSQENVFGSEEVTNGDFATDLSGWTVYTQTAAWGVDGIVINASAGTAQVSKLLSLQANSTYEVSLKNVSKTNARILLGTAWWNDDVYNSTNSTEDIKFYVTPTVSSVWIQLNIPAGVIATLDNVSVKEITNAVEYKNIPQSARELYSLEDDTWTGSNELVTNGDFATDSDWNKGTGWTISNNSLNGASVNVAQAYQAGILTENTWYWVELNLNITNGYIKVKNSAALSTSGYYSFKYFNTGGVDLNIFGYSLFTGSIDNVSVKEIIEVPS